MNPVFFFFFLFFFLFFFRRCVSPRPRVTYYQIRRLTDAGLLYGKARLKIIVVGFRAFQFDTKQFPRCRGTAEEF